MAEESFSKSDRVIVHDITGNPVSSGTILSINEFREPSMKYAVSIDIYTDDVVFVSEEQLKKENE